MPHAQFNVGSRYSPGLPAGPDGGRLRLCSQPSAPKPTAATAPTTKAPSPAATVSPVASPVAVATAYLQAMYKKDLAGMQRAFPSSKPDADRDEYRLQLTKLAVDPISREEAGGQQSRVGG